MATKDDPSQDGLAMTHLAIARRIGGSKQAIQQMERLAIRKLWNARIRRQVIRPRTWQASCTGK